MKERKETKIKTITEILDSQFWTNWKKSSIERTGLVMNAIVSLMIEAH